jgi:hypothetical protein
MSVFYKVSTKEKKNVFIRTEYIAMIGPAAGKTFFTDEWYRWGSCIIEVQEGEDLPYENEDPYACPFLLEDWEIVDQESDDGCTFEFEFSEEWTEEEKESIEELWDLGNFWDNVEITDVWTDYYGPLEIEQVEQL